MAEPLNAIRLYAVSERGRFECPRCTYLNIWGYGARGGILADPDVWNPITSTITCKGCGRHFTIGVLLWETTAPYRRNRTPVQPEDQVASVRQLSEMRRRVGGWWMQRKREHRRERVNVFVAEGCTCGPLPWSATCPIHGGESASEQE